MNNTEKDSDSKDSVAHTPYKLDIYVATALLGMNIFNETKQQLKKPLRRANLTMTQWLVLKMLFLQRANTPSKIANILNTDGASITRCLDILELRRYIERVHLTSDRRVVLLQLTREGLRIAKQLYASYTGVLINFENRLTQDEVAMWKKVEGCIAAHICATHS